MIKRAIGEAEAEQIRQAAEKWGQDLRCARLARSWTVKYAAWHMGMAQATYKRMEAGDPTVAMKFWLQAWLQVGMLPRLTEATSPHLDVAGERMRRFQRIVRVRRGYVPVDEWDY